MSNQRQIIVIGAGAAGLCTAIAAAEHGAQVTLVEQDRRVGQKILKTGNGRCNLTNQAIGPGLSREVYHNQDFVLPILRHWDCTALCSWFEAHGLLTRADQRGWVYPRTNTANSVLDVLRNHIERLGIELLLEHCVQSIATSNKGFEVQIRNCDPLSAKNIILAHSAGVVPGLKLDSQKAQPVLGPLRTETKLIKGLDGVRVDARLTLFRNGADLAVEDGEVLFRDYGVSGIAVFNLSRCAEPGDELSIDLFGDYAQPELLALLEARQSLGASRDAQAFFDGLLPPRLARIYAARGLSLPQLASALKNLRLKIIDGPSGQQAQVMRGGYDVGDFDPITLQSKLYPGLYAAGECLDVDGPCGGYNLHWAWASGLTAGLAAAQAH